MHLSLFHHDPSSESYFEIFESEKTLGRLKALDSRARRKGIEALDASRNELISIGMEVDGAGRVTKNGYGIFNLTWQLQHHPEWAETVEREVAEIRAGMRAAHGKPPRFLIWAGMGGSAEDKSAYNAFGLLKGSPRCYVLDSTDPAKLKAILGDMTRRSGVPLAATLRSTLVAGMALGMTSYEPVVNLEKLAALYDRHGIDGRANFFYMTLPGSLLDQFASARGFRRVELQLDGANTTAGRHSAPLTRGSLYPLALARRDLRRWMDSAVLTNDEVHTAWKLAAFVHAEGKAGRDKLTLLLPRAWAGIALWTKQDFEESLGKCEELGLKVVIGERPKLANYRPPADPRQDRAFLVVQSKDAPDPYVQARTALLRRAGYPVAVLTLPRGATLSHYMQFVHYAVFGMARLRHMNFVTQPGVELYKAITNRLYAEGQKAGGIERTREWQRMADSPCQVKWPGGVTLHFDRLIGPAETRKLSAPVLYASRLKALAVARTIEYGELTFFGDTRYSARGRAVRKCLDRAAEQVFRTRLKMPVDVYEGPAMNHSYHEMIIGHGKCFSTVVLSERQDSLPDADYTADYHRAQFLATQMALAERKRLVVAITLKDLEERTLAALDDFFHQTAVALKGMRV